MFWIPLLACALQPAANEQQITPYELRCEYLPTPLGIDTREPRLSWSLQSSRRGARPTSYEIQVSTSENGEPDLWSTGRVRIKPSDAPIGSIGGAGVPRASATAPADAAARLSYPAIPYVVYAGKPLRSGQRAYWRVRIWDEKKKLGPWSEWSWFETALLDPSDWKAQWISSEPARQPNADIRDAKWIWRGGEGDPRNVTEEGERYFRKLFTLPEGWEIASARLLITADDRFDAMMNGAPAGGGKWPALLESDVTKWMRPGQRNAITVMATNAGGSAGLIAKLIVTGKDGTVRAFASDKTWTAAKAPDAEWATAKYDDSKWDHAVEAASFGELPWGDLTQQPEPKPAPHLRKAFELTKPVKSARAYVCGLGYYHLVVNGKPGCDSPLQPAFTRYDRRVLYGTHDVTKLLESGKNTLGVVLGNGWYNFHPKAVWNFDKTAWRSDPVLKLQLDVTYEDGSTDRIVSDTTWKWAEGALRSDQLFIGTVVDARKDLKNWATSACDDGAWSPVHVRRGPAGRLVAQAMPPVRASELLRPCRVTEPQQGVYVFDMGRNFAGAAVLMASGPAGAKVTLKYGERLGKEGLLDQRELNVHNREGTFQTDTFILSGELFEPLYPSFGYYGFRYVEVHGLPTKPTADTLIGVPMHTDYESVGTFTCSNALLNEIYRCTLNSYGANFFGYPTDCPQREKNGWTGDAHLAAELAMYSFNNVPAYEKWMNDFHDEQRDSGELPGIVPTSGWGYHWGNGPAWDSAYVLIPWYLYSYYGDLRVLEQHYDRMKRYVDYLGTRANGHILSIGLGDWVPVKTQTPVEVTSTGYYFVDASIVANAARLLGKADDAARYAALAGKIRAAFREKLAGKDGLYTGSQTALSCLLYQDLASDDERDKLLGALASNVKATGNHLDCGILGTKYLLHALTDGGRSDLAYAVASQRSFPSWGSWICEHGATSLWESWDGAGSLNHIMLGDVVAWMYKGLAGIYPDSQHPGFEHFFIRPHAPAGLDHAKAEYRSIRGLIVSEWKREAGQFTLKLQVPPGTTATLILPQEVKGEIRESGGPLEKAAGVSPAPPIGKRPAWTLASGRYEIVGAVE